MQISGLKKDIEQLKKAVKSEKKQDLTTDEFWEEINKERISEGKRPVIHIEYNTKGHMVSNEFYEVNIPKIDEYRISEGKEPLFPMYLAGEYEKVKNELLKYDANFLWKMPHSMILDELCQPLADLFGFENIDMYHEAERLFMQDQQLYHLHHKDELGEEFRKYLTECWEKEGAVLEFDIEKGTINRQPAEHKQIEHKMIVSDRAREIIEPVIDVCGEYRFTETVKIMNCFEFVDSAAVPGQIITLKYTQTGEYKGEWSAEYSHTGKVLPISNIKLWVWIHQLDINQVVREIIKGRNKNEPTAA